MEQLIILSVFSNANGRRSFKPTNNYKCTSIGLAENYAKENNIEFYDIKLNGKVINRNGYGSPTKTKKDPSQKEPVFIEVVKADLVIAHLIENTKAIPTTWYEFKKGNGEIGVTYSCQEDASTVIRFLSFNIDFEVLDTIEKSFALSFRTLTNSFTQTEQWQPNELAPETIQQKKHILNSYLMEQKYASFSWGPILQTTN